MNDRNTWKDVGLARTSPFTAGLRLDFQYTVTTNMHEAPKATQ